ncbi:hypothetical protein CO2235_170003 [Cupriavidus oxalaticus]|uniref:Uncharacterized protein n=1 Tax=Cupriavidus oxalaticus TaxID=96344 RepID=A0A375FZY8_9BURK|nr:hypothetical protein CO2235_170003 [Cupriavidus oxalaticus]
MPITPCVCDAGGFLSVWRLARVTRTGRVKILHTPGSRRPCDPAEHQVAHFSRCKKVEFPYEALHRHAAIPTGADP